MLSTQSTNKNTPTDGEENPCVPAMPVRRRAASLSTDPHQSPQTETVHTKNEPSLDESPQAKEFKVLNLLTQGIKKELKVVSMSL